MSNSANYSTLYTALKTTVKLMKDRDLTKQRWLHFHDGPLAWAKEHRTVRFSVGRRMGHTTMAFELAKEYPNSVILFHSREMEQIQKARDSSVTTGITYSPIASPWDLVIVDVACLLSKTRFDKIIHTCTTRQWDPLYVLLQ